MLDRNYASNLEADIISRIEKAHDTLGAKGDLAIGELSQFILEICQGDAGFDSTWLFSIGHAVGVPVTADIISIADSIALQLITDFAYNKGLKASTNAGVPQSEMSKVRDKVFAWKRANR